MLNNIVGTLNNVGSKTLFNAVFINPEQVVRFLAVQYGILLHVTRTNVPFFDPSPKFVIIPADRLGFDTETGL